PEGPRDPSTPRQALPPAAGRRSVRSAQALPARIDPQLLEPELEHVEQAAAAPGEVAGLEQGLFLQRVEVEMLCQAVDAGLVVDAGLDQARLLPRAPGAPEIAQHDFADRRPQIRAECVVRRLAPAHHGLPVGRAGELAMDHELPQTAEDDVEAAVR